MELQHFSHQHPLILSEEKNDDGHGIKTCKGCCEKISAGFSYSCRDCSFFLHKFCAKLPQEMMEHPLHPQHMLTLLLLPAPYVVDDDDYFGLFKCNACGILSGAFTYHCSLCSFNLDMSCAARAQSIEHRSHEHPLSHILSPALFKCHACGTEEHGGGGVSYMCNTCRFWIHEDCASLPATLKNSSHVHDLILRFDSVQLEPDFCRICTKRIYKKFWFYSCTGCNFYFHVNCSTNKKLPFRKKNLMVNIEDHDETNSIHLPVTGELVNTLIDQFMKQISLRDSKREAELNHFIHEHPLTLFNAHSDNNLGSASELSILNENKIEKLCEACLRPVSILFYYCSLCNFFIHKWCAKLPNKLRHPCHPHPLILLTTNPEGKGIFYCSGCSNYCNGFVFHCVKCEVYNLDVKCASLPISIMHEAHEHPLLLMRECVGEGCVACDQCRLMISYGCVTCNFSLHYKCALLPRTIKHRYDEHPFNLICDPIENGPDEYVCEFCEKDIDPKCWFYHCIDCDQSACAKCIYKEEEEYPNFKLGSTCKFDIHQHPLTLVRPTNKSLLCDACDKDYSNGGKAFKCVQCNIMFHEGCVRTSTPHIRLQNSDSTFHEIGLSLSEKLDSLLAGAYQQ